MTRTMYDSVTATHIPGSATMVAGYLAPSKFAWSAADWARFPHAVKVRIAIFANVNDGHVLDVEPGDATPAQAPGWVAMRRHAGADPTVYCNASTWPTVRDEFRRQHVPEPHYWIAKYDGVRNIPPGAVAKQYANPPVHGQGHFDLSMVVDYWPGVDAAPPKEDHDMELDDVVDWDAVNAAGPGKLGWSLKNTRDNAAATRAKVDTLTGLVKDLSGNISASEGRIIGALQAADGDDGVDVSELADALMFQLGDDLAEKLVTVIGDRLSSPPATG